MENEIKWNLPIGENFEYVEILEMLRKYANAFKFDDISAHASGFFDYNPNREFGCFFNLYFSIKKLKHYDDLFETLSYEFIKISINNGYDSFPMNIDVKYYNKIHSYHAKTMEEFEKTLTEIIEDEKTTKLINNLNSLKHIK